MLSDVAVAHRRLRLGKELLGGESTDSSACLTRCRPHRWSLAQAAFPHRVNGGFLKRSCVWGWALAGILPGCLPLGSSCPRGPVMVTFLVLYSGGLQGPASDIF